MGPSRGRMLRQVMGIVVVMSQVVYFTLYLHFTTYAIHDSVELNFNLSIRPFYQSIYF